MSFTTITVPAVGEATRQSLIADVIGDLNDLNSRLLSVTGSGVIPNGSFEADTAAANTTPSGWTWSAQTGGTRSIVATSGDQAQGKNSFKATRTSGGSDGGGTLTTTDFFEVSPQRRLTVSWLMKSTVATMKNIVKVFWYQYDQSASATASTTIYSEGSASPTSWVSRSGQSFPPPDAKYAKIEFTLCDSSGTAAAGSTYIDGVAIALEGFSRRVEYRSSGQSYFTALVTGYHRITCVGGGGGGETRGTTSGEGGGGGELARSIVSLTAGTSYTLTVGAGGATGTAGADGADSSFNTTTVVAKGGKGGDVDALSPSHGQGGSGGTGDYLSSGQNGLGTGSCSGGMSGQCLLGIVASGGGGGGGGSTGAVGAQPGGGGGAATTGGAGGNGIVVIEW